MKFDVITIGTATKDIYLGSPLFKVFRDPSHLKKIGFKSGEAECFALGSKLEVETFVPTIGGGAVNTAVTFARQGLNAGALIRIGHDSAGDEILLELEKEKVKALPIFDKKNKTGYSTLLLTSEGERTVLVYRGASHGLTKGELPTSIKSRWAYIVPGTIEYSVMIQIISLLKKQNIKIAMNPSHYYVELPQAKIKRILSLLDVVIVNREEASDVTKVAYSNIKGIFKKFDDLVPGIAVMTDGPKGVYVSDGKKMWSAGIFDQKVIDRTGAGDAFGSGFVSALIRGKKIEECIRIGTANATSVVEYIGAQEGILKKQKLSSKKWKKLHVHSEVL